MERNLKPALRAAFWVHVVGGLGLLVALLFASPLILGEGRIAAAMAGLERIDFRWALAPVVLLVWLLPIVAVVAWRQARRMEFDEALTRLLEKRSFPIQVDIDTRIPVHFDSRLRVPVELDTRLNLEEEIEIEAEVPIRTEIPIDAEVQTKVLGIGSLKVPIRTQVPVDMVLPVRARVRLTGKGLPIHLKEEAVVELPPIDVPLRSTIETRLQFLGTVKSALRALRSRKNGSAEAPEQVRTEVPPAT